MSRDRKEWEMRKALVRRILDFRMVFVHQEQQLEKYSALDVTAMEEKEAHPGWLFITLALTPAENAGALHWAFPYMTDGCLGVVDEVVV